MVPVAGCCSEPARGCYCNAISTATDSQNTSGYFFYRESVIMESSCSATTSTGKFMTSGNLQQTSSSTCQK